MWTVTFRTTDFPNHYVARQWLIGHGHNDPTDLILVSGNIEVLRDALARMGHVRIERSPTDDPVILESWL